MEDKNLLHMTNTSESQAELDNYNKKLTELNQK